MPFDRLEIFYSWPFLITFGLVLGGFLPMLLSIAETWFASEKREKQARREAQGE